MSIDKLEVWGFRSLKQVVWQPGALNVVIGPNGSGKSNLLKLLELMVVAARGGLGKHIQRAGGMEPLVWDGDAQGLGFRVRTTPLEPGQDVERDSLTYSLDLARLGATSTYRVDGELLTNHLLVNAGGDHQPAKLIERTQQRAVMFDAPDHALTAAPELVPEDEALLSLAAGPFTTNRLISLFQADLAGWCIYQDLHTDSAAPIRQPTLARSEAAVAPDGQNLISVLHTLYTTDRAFKRGVNDAMRAAFGSDFEELVFPPAADQRIQLRVRWSSLRREQTAADLSDGTLRFLFLLAVLANPKPPGLVAIDEPETGLHPAMLPIVAEYAVEASRRSQVILTTHSAELLDAFSESAPTTTVVGWDAGQTRLQVLSDDVLRHWLADYTLGRLYRSGELEGMARGSSCSSKATPSGRPCPPS
jgi:predicted ATPase